MDGTDRLRSQRDPMFFAGAMYSTICMHKTEQHGTPDELTIALSSAVLQMIGANLPLVWSITQTHGVPVRFIESPPPDGSSVRIAARRGDTETAWTNIGPTEWVEPLLTFLRRLKAA